MTLKAESSGERAIWPSSRACSSLRSDAGSLRSRSDSSAIGGSSGSDYGWRPSGTDRRIRADYGSISSLGRTPSLERLLIRERGCAAAGPRERRIRAPFSTLVRACEAQSRTSGGCAAAGPRERPRAPEDLRGMRSSWAQAKRCRSAATSRRRGRRGHSWPHPGGGRPAGSTRTSSPSRRPARQAASRAREPAPT
jgi:hypothetical protein